MLLSLKNNQKRYRSNARLHILLIQNGFHINFQMFSAVAKDLPSKITSILLLTGTIGIVNNRNILTDRTDERKYLEKKYNEL